MAKNIDVCSDWHGTSQEDFNFTNHNSTDVTVCAAANQTWPFNIASPITVPAKGGGSPGKIAVSLLQLPNGTYTYDVDGCITGGQPKSVTIP
jgi:hypothetical protein